MNPVYMQLYIIFISLSYQYISHIFVCLDLKNICTIIYPIFLDPVSIYLYILYPYVL